MVALYVGSRYGYCAKVEVREGLLRRTIHQLPPWVRGVFAPFPEFQVVLFELSLELN